jgi:hypothetical protein
VIAAFSPHPVAGSIFIDGDLPHPSQTRLEEIETAYPEIGNELRKRLEKDGVAPQWTDEDLREVIPDPALRQGLLAELHPRELGFYDEPLPRVES